MNTDFWLTRVVNILYACMRRTYKAQLVKINIEPHYSLQNLREYRYGFVWFWVFVCYVLLHQLIETWGTMWDQSICRVPTHKISFLIGKFKKNYNVLCICLL